MTGERVPRVRRAAVPSSAAVVVRGHPGDDAITREQAEQFRRRFDEWGRWGVSAFYARNDAEIDDLAFDRLQRFAQLRIYRVVDLEAAGFDIVPTFRTPHVTITWSDDLDQGIRRLDAARHESRPNPYHE